MKIRKIIVRIAFVIVVLAVAGGAFYFNTLLPIITGYAAKNLSSGIFVSGRTQESIENEDLNFSFIKYTRNKVDYEKKSVTSSFLWHKSKAVYVEDFGCTLLNDFDEAEIKGRPYPIFEPQPQNPDTIPWPMGNVVSDTVPQGIDMKKLTSSVDWAFGSAPPQKGTFAVAVVYKGQLVAEKYRADFKPNTRFLSWSMAKSFTNAMIGLMVKAGRISIENTVNIDEWGEEKKEITLKQLMNMTSGLEWNEDYGNNSDVNAMLHKVGDMAKYSYSKPLLSAPGSQWLYSSGTTNIVQYILRGNFDNDAQYLAYPREALFNKIGMTNAIWEVDASGTFVGSSYIYATMRDYARFGLLYLNKGKWLDKQILPIYWTDFTTEEAPGSKGRYGAFFYINKAGTDYPDVPRDLFYCRGHDGQYIYIIPSKQLVVVRTGFSKEGWFDLNRFLSNIAASVKE